MHLAAAVVPVAVASAAVDRFARRRSVTSAAYVATLTWAVTGATSLRREALAVERSVCDDDLDRARARLRSLCGRDPSALGAAAIRRAAIESVAENTSDAAVAPLVWGAVAGPVGLVTYRAVNTLDAMVGHHSERHEIFGWTAARLDDVANLFPARLTAALTALLAPSVGGCSRDSLAVWRRDACQHPSPNAGACEAAFAGALGLRVGGPTVYPYGVSHRPWLGAGRDPDRRDVQRALALSQRVVLAAALLCAVARVVGGVR